jgi:hypothetical protein
MRSVLLSLALVATMATSSVATPAVPAPQAAAEVSAPAEATTTGEVTGVQLVTVDPTAIPAVEVPPAPEPAPATEEVAQVPATPAAADPAPEAKKPEKPGFLAESRAVGEAARQAEKARVAAIDREHPGPVPPAKVSAKVRATLAKGIEAQARAETQLEELGQLRDMFPAELILRAFRYQDQLRSGTRSAVEKLLLQERIDAVERVLRMRLDGMGLTREVVADIRIRHEWAKQAILQGRVTAHLPDAQTACGEPASLYGLFVKATSGDRVNVRLYKALTNVLNTFDGMELEAPSRPGTGWFGTNYGAELAY